MSKKITYDEALLVFRNRGLYLEETREEFDILNLSKDKLRCHCINHPNIPLQYYFTVVKSGRFGCKSCRAEKDVKRRNMTIEEKMDLINSKDYAYVSGDLNRILNPLSLICKNGHECVASINDLLRMDCVCSQCNGRLPSNYWTIEKCQEWMDSNTMFNGYKILDLQNNRVHVKCPIESHQPYWTNWNHIYLEKTICRECYYDKEGKINWTLERAKQLFGQYGYTILDESLYVSSHQRVPCYDEFGFIYMASIHYLVMGRTKFSLWKNNPYVVHNINLYCKLFRPDYEFVSQEYYGSKTEHRWKYTGDCIEDEMCDREFDLKFGYFVNGNCGHPMLSKSKLEAKCQSILDKYHLTYKSQKTFDNCVYKNKLRFDFYLVINGEEICIEVDGNQHQYPVDKFGGLEGLAEIQKRDAIKNQYCLDHDIRLIRIPESKFKYMEEIIINELKLDTPSTDDVSFLMQ